MTDNEIIKALECCRDNDNNLNMEKCFEECPYDGECAGKFMQGALSLINRQKEEIKELESEIDKQYEQAKADILGNMADGGTSCRWCIAERKAEALYAFAQRLHDEAYKGCSGRALPDYVMISVLDIYRALDDAIDEIRGRCYGV